MDSENSIMVSEHFRASEELDSKIRKLAKDRFKGNVSETIKYMINSYFQEPHEEELLKKILIKLESIEKKV